MDKNPIALFQPYAKQLDQFAIRHNLRVDKYRHGEAMWSFYFAHPLGGHGRVYIQINNQGQVFLLRNWTLHLYEKSLRRMRNIAPVRINDPANMLEAALLDAVHDVLEWKLDSLNETDTLPAWVDPPDIRRYPKPEF